MKWLNGLLYLTAVLAGLAAGRWVLTPRMAEAEVRRLSAIKDEEGSLKALMRLAEVDRVRAFDLLLTLEGDDSAALLKRLMQELPPEAGTELVTAFLRHPELHHVGQVGHMAFRCCARVNPGRAWQEMTARAGRFIPAFLPALAEGMAQHDPQAAMAFAPQVPSPMQRKQFVQKIIEEWSGRDGTSLLKWLREQPDREELAKQVRWFRLKMPAPSGLAEIAELLPKDFITRSLGAQVMPWEKVEDAWVEHTGWLLDLPAGETKERLCTAAAMGLASLDPEAALKLLPEIKDARARTLVTSAVAGYRAAASPQEGLAYAKTLSEEEESRKARNAAYYTWADNDPASAAKHALESDDLEARVMLMSAGHGWARTDPEAACRFALEQDQKKPGRGGMSYEMLPAAVQTWATTEPVGAARWVKALPEGAQRDRAVAAVAAAIVFRLPEEALQWAQAITNATLRQQSLRNCLMSWSYKDKDKPQQWVRQASLDEATKERLTTYLKPMTLSSRPGGTMTNLSDGVFVIH